MTRILIPAVTALCLATFAARADTPPGVRPDWLEAVKRDIAAREYRFSAHPDGSFSAPNRAQDLRTRVVGGGVQVVSRTKNDSTWKLELRLARAGREGALADVPAGDVSLDGARAEIHREGPASVEWYVNDEHGL